MGIPAAAAPRRRVKPSATPPGPKAPPPSRPVLTVVRGGEVREGVRWNRVMAARARIAVGYYDRPDVLERLAEAVLEEIDSD